MQIERCLVFLKLLMCQAHSWQEGLQLESATHRSDCSLLGNCRKTQPGAHTTIKTQDGRSHVKSNTHKLEAGPF